MPINLTPLHLKMLYNETNELRTLSTYFSIKVPPPPEGKV